MATAPGAPVITHEPFLGVQPALGENLPFVDLGSPHDELQRAAIFGRLQNMVEALLEFLFAQLPCHSGNILLEPVHVPILVELEAHLMVRAHELETKFAMQRF